MRTNTSKRAQNNLSEDSFDAKQFLFEILLNWKWILLSLILCIGVAVLYNRYAAPLYKATASIMIKDEKKGGVGLLDNPILRELDLGDGGKLVENEVEILKSYDLMESMVRKLQLFLNIKSKGNISSTSVFGKEVPIIIKIDNPDTIRLPIQWSIARQPDNKWKLNYGKNEGLSLTPGKWYSINGLRFQTYSNPAFRVSTDGNNTVDEYILEFTPVFLTVSKYLLALSVEPPSKTASLITLGFTNSNQAKAKTALGTLIDIYNQQALENKNVVTTNTLEFLNSRLSIIERELRTVEGQVEALKSTNKITDIPAEAQQYLEQAKQVDAQKALQQTQLSILEGLEDNLKANQDNPKLVASGSGIAEPSLIDMTQRHNNLVLEKERQAERLGPKNPIVVDLNNQIANVRQTLLGNITNLKQAYRINLNDLAGKDAELNFRIRNIPKIEKNLVQIKRDQSVKEQLYFLLLQKREESAIALASTTSDTRSIERSRSLGIVSPQKMLVFSIGILAGLLIPIGIIYLRGLFNNKIKNKEELDQKCKAPLLGEISFIKKDGSPIVVQKDSRSVVAEQFRVIRTNIAFTRAGNSPKTILITSHRPSEGKSFTSLNLAASFALLNKKVVVLEFDLRKPRLSSALNIPAEATGISNYLAGGELSVDKLLKEVPGYDSRFWLLPTGPLPPNPAELILGERMKVLMDELSERFDYIILDTPPYGLVTDSSLLSSYADINIIVLRQGFTFDWVLREINKKIEDNPSQLTYTILNRVGEKGWHNGYTKYGYGYTEYFDAAAKKRKWWKK